MNLCRSDANLLIRLYVLLCITKQTNSYSFIKLIQRTKSALLQYYRIT